MSRAKTNGHGQAKNARPNKKRARKRKVRENRRLYALRQTAIEDALGTEWQLRQNPAIGIDDCGNPRVRGADQGHAFLDRPQPRLRKMLMGTGHKPGRSAAGREGTTSPGKIAS